MILDTDYKTYAVVFSCDDLWFNKAREVNARGDLVPRNAAEPALHRREPSCADKYENLQAGRQAAGTAISEQYDGAC